MKRAIAEGAAGIVEYDVLNYFLRSVNHKEGGEELKDIGDGYNVGRCGVFFFKDGKAYRLDDIDRTDPVLVRIVEEMGYAASGGSSSLHVVEIPDGVNWKISEYEGSEIVEEVHRVWM
jgi:hypothetical protein